MFKTNILWDNLEEISEEVHKAWMAEKEKQGFHRPTQCRYFPHVVGKEESEEAVFSKHCPWCHTDMYQYQDLPENIKEYDRVTVKAVINAIDKVRTG